MWRTNLWSIELSTNKKLKTPRRVNFFYLRSSRTVVLWPEGYLMFCQWHSKLLIHFINIRSFDLIGFTCFPCYQPNYGDIFLLRQVPVVFKYSTSVWITVVFTVKWTELASRVLDKMGCRWLCELPWGLNWLLFRTEGEGLFSTIVNLCTTLFIFSPCKSHSFTRFLAVDLRQKPLFFVWSCLNSFSSISKQRKKILKTSWLNKFFFIWFFKW